MTTTKQALVTDRRIAGGPDDFMEVRHLVLRGSQRAIGRALATIARDELAVDKTTRWSDPDATGEQARWLAVHWPEHLERTHGAADAFGADLADSRDDYSFLYYYWAVPGCSNCFWPSTTTADGHNVLSRNYDFTIGTVFELMGRTGPPTAPAATARPFLVETHPSDGYSTMTLCSYELLGGALDGMNSAGLGVALMSTTEVLRGGPKAASHRNRVGVSEIQLIRFLLERAATVDEAQELLRTIPQYTMWVPCHFIVADASGKSLLWSTDVAAAPVCIHGRPGHPLCATNHLPEHLVVDVPQRVESEDRLRRLQSSVSRALASAGRASRADIVAVNRAVAATHPAGQGQYQAVSPARTLWHSVYDLDARSLSIDFYLGEGEGGTIRRTPYLEFELTV